MTILLFIFGATFAAGLFFLFSDILKLPKLATEKALLSAAHEKKDTVQSIDAFLISWAVRLSKFIRMDEYKRIRMQKALSAAGIALSPEVYEAYAIVKAGVIGALVIPCLPVMPLLTPVLVILAVLTYFKESKKAEEKLKEKRDKIESELPRFVASITQELQSSRDVLTMLENYKKTAGEAFVHELDVLTADMRSSSYEASLTRFEARINSPMLSDIVRGLIGVLRGDDGAMYFQMLSHDMKQLELQRLKSQAQKIPPKIRVFSFVMLLCFLLTYLAIIAYQIVASMGNMF